VASRLSSWRTLVALVGGGGIVDDAMTRAVAKCAVVGDVDLDIVDPTAPSLARQIRRADLVLVESNAAADCTKLVRHIRDVAPTALILAFTENQAEPDNDPLRAGADDAIFGTRTEGELVVRIRKLLFRNSAHERFLHAHSITLDRLARAVTVRGQALNLQPRQMDVLAYLIVHAGRAVDEGELLREIWQTKHHVGASVVRTCISNLRKTLGPFGHLIETVRGYGWRMRA